MAWIAQAVGAALGTIGTIGANLSGDKTRKELQRLKDSDPSYTENPYAKQRFALAQQLMNARMPGVANMERNIYGTQANTLANINRNATDSSQALALAAAAQGQTNDAFNQLGQLEMQNQQNMLQNYNQANAGMVAEGDKKYEDMIRRWSDQVNIAMAKHAIRGQQGQNMVGLGSMIGNMNFGGGGGMGGGGK